MCARHGVFIRSGNLAPFSRLLNLTSLKAGHNAFSGDLKPLAALTVLNYLSMKFNQLNGDLQPLVGLTRLTNCLLGSYDFSGAFPTLQPFYNMPHLSQLDVSNTKLTNKALYVDLTKFTRLSIVDVSQNSLMSGSLNVILSGAPSVVLNTTGTLFDCPLPSLPSSVLLASSPCVVISTGTMLKIALVAFLVLSGVFCVTQAYHSTPFAKAMSFVAWAYDCFVLGLYIAALVWMIHSVRNPGGASISCDVLNQRRVFLPALPMYDYITESDGTRVYLGPNGQVSNTPPPLTQSFSDFMVAFAYWNTGPDALTETQTFASLCSSFGRGCAPSSVTTCASSTWTMPNTTFLPLVIVLLTYMAVLEVVKLGSIVYAMNNDDGLPWPQYTLSMVRTSPFMPLLFCSRTSLPVTRGVLQSRMSFSESMWVFLWQTLCLQVRSCVEGESVSV